MSEIRLSAVPYERCKQGLISFRNLNRETQRDERYFDWRYLGRPGRLEPVVVWAETAGGRTIGSMSIVPHHYMADNVARVLGVLGDISVARECRGKGIARQMLEFLPGLSAVRKLDGCIVLPNLDALRPLEKAGWTPVSRLERYVKLINIEKRLNKKLTSKAIRAASPAINRLLSLFSYETYPLRRRGYAGAIADGFDPRFDGLWNESEKKGMIIGFRNREYLEWRYLSHPAVKYRIYTIARDTDLYGYIVFHGEGDTCYIDDFMTKRQKDCQTLLMAFFLRYIKGGGLFSSVVLQASDNDLSLVALARFGFFRRHDYQNLLMNFNNEALFKKSRSWYLTAGDKDV